MALNRYFNQTTFVPEQDLVQDLIDESIQIYGHQVYYIPRDTVNLDAFLGEDPLAKFTAAYPIEMYIKTVESFQGQSEFISKFGLHIEDQATFLVSVRRFDESVIMYGNLTFSRPRENDLLYVQMTPTNRYLFEIRFVENKEQLFKLGKLYTYELRCEMMNFTNEKVNTNIESIDEVAQSRAYTIEMLLRLGDGNYIVDETVFQGANLASATATGLVYDWTSTANTLQVQQVTGTFLANTVVRGVTSNAAWTTANTDPSTAPSVNDPVSDNEFLQGNPLNVVATRGSHILDT
tara:strand:+ start:1070 stop:1945 length:876 start_codon:yes stop_codon:yes gene_type:complete